MAPLDICKSFGQRLRALRLELGLSQATLAERANVTPEYISRIERGAVGPSMEVIAKLAHALGVPPQALFAFDVTPRVKDRVLSRMADLLREGSSEERHLILKLSETVMMVKRGRKRE